jgi:phage-related protein
VTRSSFIKKTEKTPTGEVDLALQRAKELKP